MYTTSTNKLKITELDFDSIKSALKTYLSGQEVFKDYNFEGSAMSILLDVLAYNTHYNAFYTNMLASEMFMDSASLRSSVVSLAKHLGYVPASKKGSVIYLDLTFTDGTNPVSIQIPKNTKVSSRLGNRTFTFLSTETILASKTDTTGQYVATNVKFKEGIAFSSVVTALGTDGETFPITNEDVDIDTLNVYVNGDAYLRADDITEINSNSKIYFIQEGRNDRYEIYFGNGTLGKAISSGDSISIIYNVSVLGSDGNGARTFVLSDNLAPESSISLSAGHTRSFGGAERETASTIKLQAPGQYALQKRVVTENDYRTRLINDYNVVDSVRVWGGEENVPPQYGSVFICIKPKTGYVLSDAEKTVVANDILKKRNMVTITPVFVDPDYLFIVPTITAAYDPRIAGAKTPDQIKLLILTAISDYSSAKLDKFDEYFRHSVLSRAIDDVDKSITNNTNEILIKKRIRPLLTLTQDHAVRFDNPLYRPHAGHRSILSSTRFTYRGVERCSLADMDGMVKVIRGDYNDPNMEMIDTVGTISYTSGEVLLNSFNVGAITDGSDYLYLTVKPAIDDIVPEGNTILKIENADVSITLIDDTNRTKQNKVQGY